jgi:hypothetical protein
MSPDDNKAFVRRLFEEVWNAGSLAVLDEALPPIAGSDGSGSSFHGYDFDRTRRDVAAFRAAYPHLRFTVEQQWAAENTVVTAWTALGTDQQCAQGHYASNAEAIVSGVEVTRFPS